MCFVQQPSNTADCAASATNTGVFKQEKCLRDDDALSVHAGAASSEEPEEKTIITDFSANQGAGGGCLTLKMG